MIFLLKGRSGAAMKILIGIALLLLGLIRHGHTPLPLLIGAVLIVWGIASAINAWRTGKTANTQAPDRSGRR
jgi:uncharacterized membrane protein HdeD (DUF308 family)